MPSFVVDARCKGNGKCVEICPSDIIRLDPVTNKAYNIEPDMCWECFSCVKLCPEKAIQIRPYADIAPLMSEISVTRDEAENTIDWSIKYRDSRNKDFRFPIRTRNWNTISLPDMNGRSHTIEDQNLAQEPDQLLTGTELPTTTVFRKRTGGM